MHILVLSKREPWVLLANYIRDYYRWEWQTQYCQIGLFSKRNWTYPKFLCRIFWQNFKVCEEENICVNTTLQGQKKTKHTSPGNMWIMDWQIMALNLNLWLSPYLSVNGERWCSVLAETSIQDCDFNMKLGIRNICTWL